MKKITGLLFPLLTALFATGALLAELAYAAPPANTDQARTQVAPHLQHLRDIAQRQQKVRVIARFKASGSGTPNERLDNSRRALRTLSTQRGLQNIAEYSEFPVAAY